MNRYLFDADAFHAFRQVSMLTALVPALKARGVVLEMTGYIARHELQDIDRELRDLEAAGVLKIHDVRARTPAHDKFKALKKAPGVHKGEAEAIAWAVTEAFDGPFITHDKRAREAASQNGLVTYDVFDFFIDAVELELVSLEIVREKTAHWEDPESTFGRPKDFKTFRGTYESRRTKRAQR